jgi:pantothenate kinase type III
MLRNWIRAYDEINASTKDSWETRHKTTAKEPEIEQQLHKLFAQNRSIGQKVNFKWFQSNTCIIYSNLYPHRVVRIEGKQISYTRFAISCSWFIGFLQRKRITFLGVYLSSYTLCICI